MIFRPKHKRLLIGLSVIILGLGLAVLFKFDHYRGELADTADQSLPPTPTPAASDSPYVLLNVPFFAQAPNAHWDDPRQQDGCEETSLIMAWLWATGQTETRDQVEAQIIDMSEFEKTQYGNYLDLDAQDTAKLMNDYFHYDQTEVRENITLDDIKNELRQGKVVIVPANGQKLGNPNFTGAGPLTHMLVVRGFDDATRQIITNDPGTRNGNLYKYNYDVFYDAMVNYPSGHHEDQTGRPKAMLVVSK